MPDIQYDPAKRTFRFSSEKDGKTIITGLIQVEYDNDGPISWSSPVYAKFVGAHWHKLRRWLDSLGEFNTREVHYEVQYEFAFKELEVSDVV